MTTRKFRSREYTLRRTKRDTIGIYVKDGAIEVRAPDNAMLYEIESFIAEKENWIDKKIESTGALKTQRDNFILNYGSRILLRGASYPICAKEGDVAGFDGEKIYMPANLTPQQIKKVCVLFYKHHARNYLIKRTKQIAEHIAFIISDVRVNSSKGRWGSCSKKKVINLSWRLILAEDDVIDYVIMHELAHTIKMNHSELFWSVVEIYLPDYKERKKRLKDLQLRLRGEDWDT